MTYKTETDWHNFIAEMLDVERARFEQHARSDSKRNSSTPLTPLGAFVVRRDPRTLTPFDGDVEDRLMYLLGDFHAANTAESAQRAKLLWVARARAMAVAGDAYASVLSTEAWLKRVREGEERPPGPVSEMPDRESTLIVMFEHSQHGRAFFVAPIDGGGDELSDPQGYEPQRLGDWNRQKHEGFAGMFVSLLPPPGWRTSVRDAETFENDASRYFNSFAERQR